MLVLQGASSGSRRHDARCRLHRIGLNVGFDFGLAKALREGEVGDEKTRTATLHATAEHAILGTAPYMSPEQASGSPQVDRRTDVWAFGCVLFEMLSGGRAFAGPTITDTFAAIHGQDPDWSLLPDNTPPRIRSMLWRCLEKDPDRRLHHVADARVEIDDAPLTINIAISQWSKN